MTRSLPDNAVPRQSWSAPPYVGRVLSGDRAVATCFQAAEGILVTAGHVVADLRATQPGAVARVQPMSGGDPINAEVLAVDYEHDLAVLRTNSPLAASVPGWAATDSVRPDTRVLVTGVVSGHEPSPVREVFRQAHGVWDGLSSSRGAVTGVFTSSFVTAGMSGAPVCRTDTDVVVGIVIASTDAAVNATVSVARVEDLYRLLTDVAHNLDDPLLLPRIPDALQFGDRVAAAEERLAVSQARGQLSDTVNSLLDLGQLAIEDGDLWTAERRLVQAMAITDELNDPTIETALHHQLGWIDQLSGRFVEAGERYTHAIMLAADDTARVAGYHQLGLLAHAQGDYTKAHGHYYRAMRLAQKLDDDSATAAAVHQTGVLAQVQGHYDQARQLYEQALRLAQKRADREIAAASYHQLALLAQHTGQRDQARALFYRAQQLLDIDTRAGDTHSYYQLCMTARRRPDGTGVDHLPTIIDNHLTTARQPVAPGLVLPVYLVVDESASMAPVMDLVNDQIAEMITYFESDPMVSDLIRLTLIGFSDTARSYLHLADFRNLATAPQLITRGGTSFSAAFAMVEELISSDRNVLKKAGLATTRPLVFFISDGVPTEPAISWQPRVQALKEQQAHIIALGLPGADPDIMADIASGTQNAVVANQRDAAVLRSMFETVMTSIAYTTMSTAGPDIKITLPSGDAWTT